MSHRQLGMLVGVVVLAAALLTWRAVTVPVDQPTLAGAGLISGVTGTTTSIGGLPLAIVHQHRPAREIRTTMAVYFLIGAGLSLIALSLIALSLNALLLSGDLTTHQLAVALELLPVLAVAALLGVLVRARLPVGVVRPAALVVCSASAVVLSTRSLLG